MPIATAGAARGSACCTDPRTAGRGATAACHEKAHPTETARRAMRIDASCPPPLATGLPRPAPCTPHSANNYVLLNTIHARPELCKWRALTRARLASVSHRPRCASVAPARRGEASGEVLREGGAVVAAEGCREAVAVPRVGGRKVDVERAWAQPRRLAAAERRRRELPVPEQLARRGLDRKHHR
eukprot:scaffold84145_cov69-Phaeocystis_antarctica.AAC.2